MTIKLKPVKKTPRINLNHNTSYNTQSLFSPAAFIFFWRGGGRDHKCNSELVESHFWFLYYVEILGTFNDMGCVFTRPIN